MNRRVRAQVARDLIAECLAVGRAEGAVLDAGLIEDLLKAMHQDT